MRLSFHSAAEADVIESARFYERRRRGLGERFLLELDSATERIRVNPDRWEIIENEVRCHSIKHFPFGIYYYVRSDETIILAVTHHSRSREYWRDRLSD